MSRVNHTGYWQTSERPVIDAVNQRREGSFRMIAAHWDRVRGQRGTHRRGRYAQTPSVFISHNHRDKSFCRQLANDLGNNGVRVWLDEAELQSGDRLTTKIEDSIDQSNCLAVVLSPRSVDSDWVKREVEFAFNPPTAGPPIKIVSLLIEDCEYPTPLQGNASIDFRSESDYERAIVELLSIIVGDRWDSRKTSQGPRPARDPDKKIQESVDELIRSAEFPEFSDEERAVAKTPAPNYRQYDAKRLQQELLSLEKQIGISCLDDSTADSAQQLSLAERFSGRRNGCTRLRAKGRICEAESTLNDRRVILTHRRQF